MAFEIVGTVGLFMGYADGGEWSRLLTTHTRNTDCKAVRGTRIIDILKN